MGEALSATPVIDEKIVAGIGCRKGTSADTVISVLADALAQAGLEGFQPAMLATGRIKAEETGIIETADRLGIPLLIVEQAALEASAPRTLTTSEVSIAHTGTPSLCEAAALATAGETAELATPRLVRDGVTCAIAIANTRKTKQ